MERLAPAAQFLVRPLSRGEVCEIPALAFGASRNHGKRCAEHHLP